mmetsp:Transcript_21628/g.60135  ORF Transcript_21628/g.60135 Transcript_21628/m.60135 type:complete len:354 (+) Transcript_21628:158-1219(+)
MPPFGGFVKQRNRLGHASFSPLSFDEAVRDHVKGGRVIQLGGAFEQFKCLFGVFLHNTVDSGVVHGSQFVHGLCHGHGRIATRRFHGLLQPHKALLFAGRHSQSINQNDPAGNHRRRVSLLGEFFVQGKSGFRIDVVKDQARCHVKEQLFATCYFVGVLFSFPVSLALALFARSLFVATEPLNLCHDTTQFLGIWLVFGPRPCGKLPPAVFVAFPPPKHLVLHDTQLGDLLPRVHFAQVGRHLQGRLLALQFGFLVVRGRRRIVAVVFSIEKITLAVGCCHCHCHCHSHCHWVLVRRQGLKQPLPILVAAGALSVCSGGSAVVSYDRGGCRCSQQDRRHSRRLRRSFGMQQSF